MNCHHCVSTSFVCDCGAWVAIVDVVDIFHVGECVRCGKIVDEACIYRGMPDTPSRPKSLIHRVLKRGSRRPATR